MTMFLMIASTLERGMVMTGRLSAGLSDSQCSCKKASRRWMCRCGWFAECKLWTGEKRTAAVFSKVSVSDMLPSFFHSFLPFTHSCSSLPFVAFTWHLHILLLTLAHQIIPPTYLPILFSPIYVDAHHHGPPLSPPPTWLLVVHKFIQRIMPISCAVTTYPTT